MTSGKCPGFVQCNVVVLSSFAAADFHQFCQLNLKACPLLAMSAPGSPSLPSLPTLGRGIDIRTYVAAYRVFKHGHGQAEEERKDIRKLWGDDLVTFTLGCSFSFEEALIEDGWDIRNLSQGVNVPMYRTHHAGRPAGVFSGDLVVSMRPFLAPDAIRAIQISTRFPSVRGGESVFVPQRLGGLQTSLRELNKVLTRLPTRRCSSLALWQPCPLRYQCIGEARFWRSRDPQRPRTASGLGLWRDATGCS
jgi:uncharacterized protein YcsI (UPF0317 family)